MTNPNDVEVMVSPVVGGFAHEARINGTNVSIRMSLSCAVPLCAEVRWHNGVLDLEFEDIGYRATVSHNQATGGTRINMRMKGDAKGFGKGGKAYAPVGGWVGPGGAPGPDGHGGGKGGDAGFAG
jgi:hypothetical protein